MALGSLRDLFVSVGIDFDPAAMKQLDAGIANIKSGLYKVTAGFAAAAASTGFFLKKAGDFEQTQIAFETMLGSAEKAKVLLQDLEKFIAETPFERKEVIDLSGQLLAVGVSADKVIERMRVFGDIAAGVGKDKLPFIVKAFQDTKVKGRLAREEIKQFRNALIDVTTPLAKKFGVTTEKIEEMATAGKISFNDLVDALEGLTAAGGRFYQMMIKQSKTLGGLTSNLLDYLNALAIHIGTGILPEAKELVKTMITWIEKNKELIKTKAVEFFKKLGGYLFSFGKLAYKVYLRVNKLTEVFGGLSGVLKKVAIGYAVLTGFQILSGLGGMVLAIGKIVAGWQAVGKAALFAQAKMVVIPALIGAALVGLFLILDDLMTYFEGGDSLVGRMIDSLKKDWPRLTKFIETMLDALKDNFLAFGALLTGIFTLDGQAILDSLSFLLNSIEKLFGGWIEGIFDFAKMTFAKIAPFVSEGPKERKLTPTPYENIIAGSTGRQNMEARRQSITNQNRSSQSVNVTVPITIENAGGNMSQFDLESVVRKGVTDGLDTVLRQTAADYQ